MREERWLFSHIQSPKNKKAVASKLSQFATEIILEFYLILGASTYSQKRLLLSVE